MSTLREQIEEIIQTEPVAVFMKGTPQMVMCGNSERALRALHAAGAPISPGMERVIFWPSDSFATTRIGVPPSAAMVRTTS